MQEWLSLLFIYLFIVTVEGMNNEDDEMKRDNGTKKNKLSFSSFLPQVILCSALVHNIY